MFSRSYEMRKQTKKSMQKWELRKSDLIWELVAHTCNPDYLGG
jgi:hypothetical protein